MNDFRSVRFGRFTSPEHKIKSLRRELYDMRIRIRDWYEFPFLELNGEMAQLHQDNCFSQYLEEGYYGGMSDEEIEEDKKKLQELKDSYKRKGEHLSRLMKEMKEIKDS